MFSRRTEPRSIASQLVVLFTLAAALLLCCGLGAFYVILVRHASEEDNLFLKDKLLALHADLSTANWTKALNEELTVLRPGEHSAYWIRVIDSKGHTVAATPGMDAFLPPQVFPTDSNLSSVALKPKNYRTGRKLFSLAAISGKAGNETYTIQVAQDRSADEQFRKEFGLLLMAAVALGLVASALLGITVTRSGLRPLAEMIRSVNRIGPGHLHERVARKSWPRELQPLATAFDGMLHRLEDSFTRLSQFSADLAHELRTPVANLLGEAQVSLTRNRTAEEYREVIESSVAECERLSGIIDNLLFLARADAAAAPIAPTLFDGRAAIEKIASFYETIAEEQQISISCTGQSDVYGDPTLFRRAVSNLLENALHHTPAHGKIVVSIANRPTQVEISVQDSGCGIGVEHIPRVFDRFYRADASRSAKGGTGLGLALVKSIAELHRGSVALSSEVNRGTTVIVTFPNKHDLKSNG